MPTDQEVIELVRKQLALKDTEGVNDEQIASTLPLARALKRIGKIEREMLDKLVKLQDEARKLDS